MAIQKIDNGSSKHMIHQLWIGDTAEELNTEAEKQMNYYLPAGYGTHATAPQKCEDVAGVKRYAGKFFCNFSRGTSCD